MFTRTLSILLLAAVALVFATAGPLYALPTKVDHIDLPQCDPLSIPTQVDEIGDVTVFPPDEALESFSLTLANPVCLPTNLTLPDPLVSMINFSGRDFVEVWYVADRETSITNFDGNANDLAFPITAAAPGHEAFRIDFVGINRPLIFESILPDGIWQAGEEWRFVLQDYTNAVGLPPDDFTSLGIGDVSVPFAGVIDSSGSIIAIVPEPATCVLMMVGLAGMLVRPWKRDL